jgi:hypothetical protein
MVPGTLQFWYISFGFCSSIPFALYMVDIPWSRVDSISILHPTNPTNPTIQHITNQHFQHLNQLKLPS